MDDPGVRDRSRRWNSAFTEGIGGAIFGTGVLAADLAKAAGWASNLAVAEWAIRCPADRRSAPSISQHAGASA